MNIMAVRLNHRTEIAPKFQEIITKYGCIIKTRIGLHEATDETCSHDGLILLHLADNQDMISGLQTDLNSVSGITIQTIKI